MIIACRGLFVYVDEPRDQARESVAFALEIHNMIDEINETLSIDLSFRTGINHGGPLVGNVLCDEIPTFDLVGDIIAESMRFAAFGDKGVIHITESVKSLLDPNDFMISQGPQIPGKTKNSFIQSYKVDGFVMK